MASQFDKNFTERGYTMNYLKLPGSGYYKTHVLQLNMTMAMAGSIPSCSRAICTETQKSAIRYASVGKGHAHLKIAEEFLVTKMFWQP